MQAPGRDFAPYVEAVGTDTQPSAQTRAEAMRRPEQGATRAAEHAARERAWPR